MISFCYHSNPFVVFLTGEVGKEENSTTEHINATSRPTSAQRRNYERWLRMAIYTLFLISGQSVSVLLGRLYYEKGGKSKWLATLVQLVAFPLVLPYYIISAPKKPTTDDSVVVLVHSKPPSTLILSSIYVSLGLLVAGDCLLYSIGLMYLPVSTYSLICSSQLAFNAFFSFFLNSQKFTPFIVNSLVLLTISSILLVVQTDSEDPSGVSKGKYVIGFICTVAASAGYGLVLSLTQLAFRKVLKRETFTVVMDMIVYQSLVATAAIVVGLFASGEWKGLNREMEEFELGKVSYLMTLIWTAIMWQVFAVGCVGLIFEASSLFSNAISVLGLPLIPVAAVVVFHDKLGGVKVISMVLAIWGFVSYVYQQYLDDFKPKPEDRNGNIQVSNASPPA
jgi:drug/metabolite transporter (DMT)-like permease